jgi:hypothetical protein
VGVLQLGERRLRRACPSPAGYSRRLLGRCVPRPSRCQPHFPYYATIRLNATAYLRQSIGVSWWTGVSDLSGRGRGMMCVLELEGMLADTSCRDRDGYQGYAGERVRVDMCRKSGGKLCD